MVPSKSNSSQTKWQCAAVQIVSESFSESVPGTYHLEKSQSHYVKQTQGARGTVERKHAYRRTDKHEYWFCLYLCKFGSDVLIIHIYVQLGKSYLPYLPSRIIERMK